MLVSLDLLKSHLRITTDEQNFLLQAYAEAAGEQVSSYIDRPIYGKVEEIPPPGSTLYDPYAVLADDRIRVSICLIVEHLYDRPDGALLHNSIPVAAAHLLNGLRVFRSPPVERRYDGEASA